MILRRMTNTKLRCRQCDAVTLRALKMVSTDFSFAISYALVLVPLAIALSFAQSVCLLRIEVLTVAKRSGKFRHWEPVFIGTHGDPYYDERLSWDGMEDKMVQSCILCVQDYDLMVLTGAFLVHKPGFKRSGRQTAARYNVMARQHRYVMHDVAAELAILFGTRAGCQI